MLFYLNLDSGAKDLAWRAFEQKNDAFVGQPPKPTTTRIAARIAHQMRQRTRRPVYQENVFLVGVRPVQGIQQGGPSRPAIRPDVSFLAPAATGSGMSRVNLEVDGTLQRSEAHQRAHYAAMRKAVSNARQGILTALTPQEVVNQTRSVFVVVNRQGNIAQIRWVRYELTLQNRVRAILGTPVMNNTIPWTRALDLMAGPHRV